MQKKMRIKRLKREGDEKSLGQDCFIEYNWMRNRPPVNGSRNTGLVFEVEGKCRSPPEDKERGLITPAGANPGVDWGNNSQDGPCEKQTLLWNYNLEI